MDIPHVPPEGLAAEIWSSTSHAAVCLAFLRAEWDKWPEFTAWHDRALIDSPDLANETSNSLRRIILGSLREPLLRHIPGDTVWWRVESLRDLHLDQLLVIGSDDWRSANDRNELLAVSRRRGEPLRHPPAAWEPAILWGHDPTGPFTILEGNNRLVNYARIADGSLAVTCYVGLSSAPCLWHLPDRSHIAGA